MTDATVERFPNTTQEQTEKVKRVFPECLTRDGDGTAIDFARPLSALRFARRRR